MFLTWKHISLTLQYDLGYTGGDFVCESPGEADVCQKRRQVVADEPEEFESSSQLNETARQTLIELDESGDERDHVDSIHEATVPEAERQMAMSSASGNLNSSEPVNASTREGFLLASKVC